MNRRHALMFAMFALVAMTALSFNNTNAVAADDDEAGFVSIFDGKTLEGWDGDPQFWRVEDGTLTGESTPEKQVGSNTFIVWTGGETGDFELRLEYRIMPMGGGNFANSGIQYRSFRIPDDKNKWRVGGYQADMEAGDTYSGILYGEQFRGILCNRGQKTVIGDNHKPKVVGSVGDSKEIQTKIKKNDWNTYRVVAKGFHFTHEINGVMTADCTDEDKEQRRDSGILAFQMHHGTPMKVQFRNIRIKKLD
ncbi:MAG: DUF1080 domain-containing protein [Phycisphaera sp.]|nr:DUF1080 domain-containing protein [Phycisphaera sp.]